MNSIMQPETIARVIALILALVGAYTDYRRGKIYNRHVLTGLLIGVFLLIWEIAAWQYGWPSEIARYPDTFSSPLKYILMVLANTGIAFAIGFGLWLGDMWAAGDAKLFTVLTFLLPLTTYKNNYWDLYPGYPLLFNTFVATLGVLIIEMIVIGIKKLQLNSMISKEKSLKINTLWKSKINELWMMFFIFLLFFLTIKTIREIARAFIYKTINIHNNVLIYFLLFLLYPPLRKLMSNKKMRVAVVVITLSIAAYISLFPSKDLNFITIISMSTTSIVIILFRWGYEFYLNFVESRPIDISKLKKGDILSEKSLERFKHRDPEFLSYLGSIMPDGLTEEQVEKIRAWYKRWNLHEPVLIKKTFPFAPSLLIGVILSWIFSGFPFTIQG